MPADSRKLYLTPAAFKAVDHGVVGVNDLSDETLRSYLALAAALADAFCATDLGIARSVERHPWAVPSRRVWPNHLPVLSVDDLRVFISAQQFGTIQSDDIFVANDDGFVEVVSLATVTYTLTPVLVNMSMAMNIAQLTYTHGYGVVVTDETLAATDGSNLIFAAAHDLWGPDYPVVVSVDGVPTTDFTVDYPSGHILFAADPSGVVTASYAYATPNQKVIQAMHMTMVEWLEERRLTAEGLRRLQSATIGAYSVTRKSDSSGWHSGDGDGLALPTVARKLLTSLQRLTLH